MRNELVLLAAILLLVLPGCLEKQLFDPYARYDFAQQVFMKHSQAVIDLKAQGVLSEEDVSAIKPYFVAADAALTAYENMLLSPDASERGYSEIWDDFSRAIASVLTAIDEAKNPPEPINGEDHELPPPVEGPQPEEGGGP